MHSFFLSLSWPSHSSSLSALVVTRTHFCSGPGHCITIASFLALDALVRALAGARGPSVVGSRVGTVLQSGTKLGRVTVTYIQVG